MRYYGRMPNWIRYTWAVIVNLITIAIVLAIFNSVEVGFQTIVVSALILIYLSVQAFLMIYGRTTAQIIFALSAEFNRIKALVAPDDFKSAAEQEELEEAEKTFATALTKMYINVAFMLVTYVIALLQLFNSLKF
jgi:hypothetical protein